MRMTRRWRFWIFERCVYRPETVDEDYVEAGYEVFQSPKYRESVAAMEGRGLRRTLFMPELLVSMPLAMSGTIR